MSLLPKQLLRAPSSSACERNRAPILNVLKRYVVPSHQHIFEVGSGTGQHAYYFSKEFKHLTWHTSDGEQYHSVMKPWIDNGPSNLKSPILYQAGSNTIPTDPSFDIIYSANTLHI